MMRNRSNQRSGLRHTRRRGSLLILVMVVLVVLVFLGTAYVQISRVDRDALQQDSISHIDEIVLASRTEIINTIRNDLVGYVGPNVAQSGPDPDWHEWYDYPYTNNAEPGKQDDRWLASTAPVFERQFIPNEDQTKHPSQIHTKPAEIIDRTLRWQHLSNFAKPDNSGLFDIWALPKSNAAAGTVPFSLGTMNADSLNAIFGEIRKLDAAYSSEYLDYGADADGDGIKDSFWTPAPIPQMGNMQYFWAVRVVDNSAKVNINTASRLTVDGELLELGGDELDKNTVTGLYPSDIDLSRLFARQKMSRLFYLNKVSPITYPDFQPYHWKWQTNSMLGIRDGLSNTYVPQSVREDDPEASADSVTRMNAIPSANMRDDTWLNSGRYFGDSSQLAFGEFDEWTFTVNHGLAANFKDSSINTLYLPHLLRTPGRYYLYPQFPGNLPDETSYEYIKNTLTYHVDPSELQPNIYLNDTDLNVYLGPGTYMTERMYLTGLDVNSQVVYRTFPEIRHMLTTYSGAGEFRSDPGNLFTSTLPSTPSDITNARRYVLSEGGPLSNATLASPERDIIAGWLQTIFKAGGDDISQAGTIANQGYLGLSTTNVSDDAELDRISYEFANALVDYVDTNTIPSSWEDSSGVTYYGLEAMPFIREVYIQLGYKDVDNFTPAHPLGPPNMPLADIRRENDATNYNSYADDIYDTWIALWGDSTDDRNENISDDTRAMAIEIANPFPRTLTINTSGVPGSGGLQLRLHIERPSGNYDMELNQLEFSISSGGSITLAPFESIIIYSNPLDPLIEADDGTTKRGEDLVESLGLSAKATMEDIDGAGQRLTYDVNSATGFDGTQLKIHLQMFDQTLAGGAGDWVTYDKFQTTDTDFSITQVEVRHNSGAAVLGGPRCHVHAQVSYARAGIQTGDYAENYIPFITNNHMDLVGTERDEPDAAEYASHYELTGTTITYRYNGNPDYVASEALGTIDKNIVYTLSQEEQLFQIPMLADDTNSSTGQTFMQSLVELGMIHMFGFSTGPAGTLAERIANAQFNIADLDNPASNIPGLHYLDLRNNPNPGNDNSVPVPQYDPDNPGDRIGLPHAALVFDLFTVQNPNDDGIDNNGNSTDDDGEYLVPGKININTVPLHIATLAAPIPDIDSTNDLLRTEAIMRAIFAYRDMSMYDDPETLINPLAHDPEQTMNFGPLTLNGVSLSGNREVDASIRPVNYLLYSQEPNFDPDPATPIYKDMRDAGIDWRDKPGISTISELLYVDRYPDDNTGAAGPDPADMQYFSWGSTPTNAPMEVYNNLGWGNPQPTDGQADKMAIYQYLANTFTTRSDVYTAYVVIYGYDVNDYEYGPKEVARYVMVLDRSGVVKAGDPVRIVAYKRVE